MPRKEGVRQLRSRKCGCELCLEAHPGNRPKTKNCAGNWQARWYDDAGNRQSATRPTKGEAVAVMTAAKAAVDAGTWLDPKRGKVKLAAWRAEWLAGRNVERSTAAGNTSRWHAHVEPRWGGVELAKIGHSKIQQWVVELELTGLSSAHVGAIVNCLDMMMAAAKRDQRIGQNPCDGIQVKASPKKHPTEMRPPTIEQVRQCVAMIRSPVYRQMPLFILETGLRFGEAAGLLPEDVDLEEGLVHVKRVMEEISGKCELRDYPKSDAGMRSVPLTSAARALLGLQYLAQPPIDGRPVFRGARGAYLSRGNYRDRAWLPATIEAGVHRKTLRPSGTWEHWPTIHDIRGLWHSRLERAGVPESTRKELIGHAKPRDVTWLYTHAAEETKALVLRALGDEVDEVELAAFKPVRLRLVG